MASLDLFNDDLFGVTSLTQAMIEHTAGEYVETRLDSLFSVDAVNTTTIWIELDGDELKLVPASERGAPGSQTPGTKRKAFPLAIPHFQVDSGILADQVQNVRAFGSESELETLQSLVNRRLQRMRNRLDATMTFQRSAAALKGIVYDSDGTTELFDFFNEFGVSQQSHSMELDVVTTEILTEILISKELSEDVLGGGMINGWDAYCGRDFFKAFTSHANVKNAYQGWASSPRLDGDQRAGFSFGDVNWTTYYGSIEGLPFIDPANAYLVPRGVPNQFTTTYGPADYNESVNTMGLPYYAKQEPMPFGKGIDMQAQTNAIHINNRPNSIILLTST